MAFKGPYVFGELWDAPVCDDAIQVVTPIGQPCYWCGELVAAGDRGFLRPTVKAEKASLEPIHRECDLRSVVGSMAHQEGRCSCQGIKETPLEISLRQEALAVWERIAGDL